MAKEKDLNPETMPLEELKALALAEAEKEEQGNKPAPKPTKNVPVADDQDDVLDNSADETDEDDDTNGDPQEFIVRREIDLSDGSGVQVFVGKGTTELEAIKDLNDKLFEAQRNASKTIRELQKKTPKTEESVERKFTDDEEYVFKQLGEKKPSDQFKTLFKEVTGMDVSEFKTSQAAVKEFQRSQHSHAVQEDFVNTHPDYIGNTENGKRISDWVSSHNYQEFTPENLEKAYQDLKKSGLLKLKSDGASATTEDETSETERIAQAQRDSTQSRSPKKSSTVSTRGSRAPVVKTGPSEDDLYKMPLDQLRKLSNEQLAKAGQQ